MFNSPNTKEQFTDRRLLPWPTKILLYLVLLSQSAKSALTFSTALPELRNIWLHWTQILLRWQYAILYHNCSFGYHHYPILYRSYSFHYYRYVFYYLSYAFFYRSCAVLFRPWVFFSLTGILVGLLFSSTASAQMNSLSPYEKTKTPSTFSNTKPTSRSAATSFVEETISQKSKSDAERNISFKNYQVENGLSNNTVFSCVQDQLGFIWFGTKDGLNRFDGYRFKVFRKNPEDPFSLGDPFVRSLLLDENNQLYVGTRTGVYRYHHEKENFTPLISTNDEVRDLEKDLDGNLWVVAGQTLFVWKKSTKKLYKFQNDRFFSATSVCRDSSGSIWVSDADGWLHQWKKSISDSSPLLGNKNSLFNSFNVFPYESSMEAASILKNTEAASTYKWIEKIQATKNGEILIATSNYGVKLFSPQSKSATKILTYNSDKTEIFARDFIQDEAGNWWIATESGLYILDEEKKQVENLKKEFFNPYALSDNAVYSLCRDFEGGIWAGTYFGGVNYYPKPYTPFEKFFPGNGKKSISGNAVREICQDNFGNLWIGTEDAGLNKLNPQTGQITQFKPTGEKTSISYPNIHGLLARNQHLWIGTFEHGLNIMDIPTGKIIRQYPERTNTKELKSNFIVTLLESRAGKVYAGTRRGLYTYNDRTASFEICAAIPSNNFVHALLEDQRGFIWIATLGNGLYCYHPGSEEIEHFTEADNPLLSNNITTLFEDSDGKIWIGTEGKGLLYYHKKNKLFFAYPSEEGLPANTVYKILEDSNRNLWITTSKGLVCLDLLNHQQKIYTTANGLLSDQFNYNSGFKDKDGTLYFGSVKGLIRFKPEAFQPNTYNAPLYITGFYINNVDVAIGKNSPLQESPLLAQSIELPHDQNSFSIDFAALGFSAPEMTEYQYRMEGVDQNWNYLTSNRKVYFTNLSPGTYLFKVKSKNADGKWSTEETTLDIKIHPPIWASKIAYALYLLLGASIIFFLLKFYHDRVAEKNRRNIEFIEHEKEKEIYQAKIDFFTNIAHEIRTPLTLIKAPLEKIMEKADFQDNVGKHLKIMDSNTERLIELTNQLLDFRKMESNHISLNPEYIAIDEVLKERFISFKTIAEKKKILMTLQLPVEPLTAFVDRDALQKILNNLFYNALSYGKKRVHIERCSPHLGFFEIRCSSDGNLIPEEMKEKIFEPFYRLKETSLQPGNGIGLALSRSLATLQGGALYLESPSEEIERKKKNNQRISTPSAFNTFVLSLPVEITTETRPENSGAKKINA